ncbi:sodium:proton antiporter NhaD [Candidatus Nomurabacteria bacterium]|nr:sodium:proton antiporter NhaD [Candidatus Nomurabacteria bacterium]MCB9819099.1 sodium:proton antiporter NhaD [Candidatus Nomurabacteria bacterium]
MALIASIIFVVGYVLITLEHYWKVNKSITATALAAVLWALIAFTSPDSHAIEEALHIISAETFSLVVFLLAAMTLVEILVHYRFFDLLRAKLFSLGLKDGAQLILIGTLTFFLSAILDNLTTTIVMVQIARRFFKGHNLLVMAGMIVVAANAGGAFSPVGDVTTIMLWLAGKFSALDIILWAFLPSLAILLVSMLLFVRQLKKDSGDETPAPSEQVILSRSDKVVISMSFASFVLPPLAHLIGLPPFMGLLLGVGLVGLTIGWFSNNAKHRDSHMSMEIEKLLGKLDITSLLFFIGILFAVGALGFLGVLDFISASLFGEDPAMSRLVAGSVLLGAFSAILDNIPLTAAAIDILQTTDPHLWILLAICVGTGGSMLVIGSAAGVVAMGMVKELSFTKYLKIAAIPAALGYIAGIGVWYIQYLLLG